MAGEMAPPAAVQVDGDTPTTKDWETSPIYLALSARLAKTESAVASLSVQVAQLSAQVTAALPHTNAAPSSSSLLSIPAPTPGPSSMLFSPFDEPVSVSASTPSATATPRIDAALSSTQVGSSDPTVAALTTQIAALSTSVAQLQRLQQAQSTVVRQNSNPLNPIANTPTPTLTSSGPLPAPKLVNQGSDRPSGPGPLPLGARPPFHPDHAGPLTAPHGGPLSHVNGLPTAPIRPDFAFARPGINRSISSSVIGVGGDDKWGPPKLGVGGGLAMNGRDWPVASPSLGSSQLGAGQGHGQVGNGLMTPSGSANGGLSGLGGGNGGGAGNGGVAAPGAGIVVTKWEHLNLKPELLRSIAKYGIGPPNKIQARVLPFMLKGSDIIAQAPPTQERIISYVVPALQLCLTLPQPSGPYRGPGVIIVTTTVDQAAQCHKLVRNVGGPLGVRSALAAGGTGSSGLQNEIAAIQRDTVHLLIGTPGKLNEVINGRGVGGGECRLLILDEVDQLIARNLYENVLSISRLLPPPRRGGNNNGTLTPGGANGPFSPVIGNGVTSPYDGGQHSPFNPNSKTPFPEQTSRFANGNGAGIANGQAAPTIVRQTCIFSNTIPTDVINFSQSLNIRDPVRVLVRREGGPNSQESVSSVTPGINLKHTYVYLTITGSARSDGASAAPDAGPGTIGSGRTAGGANGSGAQSEEANRAKEYKLDTLVKMLEDYPLWQAIVHVGTFGMLEAVVYKLQSRSWETLYIAPDMPQAQKKAVLQQWRLSLAGNGPRFLVVFDVNVKPPDVPWAPLVINFDLPRSVEGYAHRAAAAVPPTTSARQGQAAQVHGVIVSFVQAAGGDVEMLRSTECAYRFKSAEIPSVFHDLFQH